jgi:hypothetical protein
VIEFVRNHWLTRHSPYHICELQKLSEATAPAAAAQGDFDDAIRGLRSGLRRKRTIVHAAKAAP